MHYLNREDIKRYRSAYMNDGIDYRSIGDSTSRERYAEMSQFYDRRGYKLCPGTTLVFLDNKMHDLLTDQKSCALYGLRQMSINGYKDMGTIFSTMYPNVYSKELYDSLSMLFQHELRKLTYINIADEAEIFHRLHNIELRLAETIYNDGYAYTTILGSQEYQHSVLEYCGVLPRETCTEDVVHRAKVRKVAIVTYLYKLYEGAYFNHGNDTLVVRVHGCNNNILITKEMFRLFFNVFKAYIDKVLSPTRYVVLKGTHLLAAYSNVYSHTSSCMQNIVPAGFFNYIANPDTIRILVAIDSNGKIKSRRLIYKLDGIDGWYLGRVYCSEGLYYTEAEEMTKDLHYNKDILLTLPTYGDELYTQFVEYYGDMYENDFDLLGYDTNTGRMEELSGWYELPDATAYTDEQYNFVDVTSTPTNPHGQALRNPNNNYCINMKIPFKYGNSLLHNCYRYYDDLDILVNNPSYRISVDPVDDRFSYVNIKIRVSRCHDHNDYDSAGNIAYRTGRCNNVILDDIGKKLRVNIEDLLMSISGNGNTIKADNTDYCIVPRIDMNGSVDFELEPYTESINRTHYRLEQGYYISKRYLHFIVGQNVSKVCLSNISDYSVNVSRLFYKESEDSYTPINIPVDELVPGYTEACTKYGVDRMLLYISKYNDSYPSNYELTPNVVYAVERDDVSVSKPIYKMFPIRKELVRNILTYEEIPSVINDGKLFKAIRKNYIKGMADDKLVQLEPALYGEDQWTLKDQVVKSCEGIIFKVHARKLNDGRIVHKEAYRAMKLLNKFSLMPQIDAPIIKFNTDNLQISGLRIC